MLCLLEHHLVLEDLLVQRSSRISSGLLDYWLTYSKFANREWRSRYFGRGIASALRYAGQATNQYTLLVLKMEMPKWGWFWLWNAYQEFSLPSNLLWIGSYYMAVVIKVVVPWTQHRLGSRGKLLGNQPTIIRQITNSIHNWHSWPIYSFLVVFA